MSKKDYVRIAAALMEAAPINSDVASTAWIKPDPVLLRQYVLCVDKIADALAGDNPNFNRTRFYAACGVQS